MGDAMPTIVGAPDYITRGEFSEVRQDVKTPERQMVEVQTMQTTQQTTLNETLAAVRKQGCVLSMVIAVFSGLGGVASARPPSTILDPGFFGGGPWLSKQELIQGRNAPNGIAGTDANGHVTASSITVTALSGTNVTVSPTDTDTTLYTLTPSAPTTITLGAGGAAVGQKIIDLLVTQPSSGGASVALAGTIFWPNGAQPVISAKAGDKTLIRFMTVDGGRTYIGGI
ncbi:hypothetical protein M2305_000108 [Gluconobacter cerinus]|uniref:hypothetical protein n=1 Tax=Gluconobacter cerinus TaxID=38307 RepID=UPI0022265D18|nr:hypothetical protein [Gluconobacter cerinus]MCW2264161.1 hypothetical protein [Gluconobacter cerinus]